MVPIAGSCRAHCRMFSSCLTRSTVSLSGSVKLPAVPSFAACLLACLVPSCSLARPASLLASLLIGQNGLAMGVGSVCDYGGRADVMRMSCGGWLFAPRFACVPFASRPVPSTRLAGRWGDVVVACFFRISTVCRSRRHVRLAMGLVCLLVPMAVGRFLHAMCGCADFVDRVCCGCRGCFAMVYCHCVVGGG